MCLRQGIGTRTLFYVRLSNFAVCLRSTVAQIKIIPISVFLRPTITLCSLLWLSAELTQDTTVSFLHPTIQLWNIVMVICGTNSGYHSKFFYVRLSNFAILLWSSSELTYFLFSVFLQKQALLFTN